MGNLLKDTKQVVSSVDTVPTGAEKPEDKISTVSSQYTPEEIEQMAEDKGTRYVCRYVYGGDTVEYDYFEEAERICGFKRNEIKSNEMAEKFNKTLYGKSGSWKITEKDLQELGIDISDIQFSNESKVKKASITQAKSYIVVPDNDPRANKNGYITKTQRDLLCATFAVEGGGDGIGETETFANASAMLNALEFNSNKSFNENMYNNCWQWYGHNMPGVPDDGLPKDVFFDRNGNLLEPQKIQNNLTSYNLSVSFANNLNNDGTLNLNNLTVQNSVIGVDTALSGVRAFSNGVQCWGAGDASKGEDNHRNAFYTIDRWGAVAVDDNGNIIG